MSATLPMIVLKVSRCKRPAARLEANRGVDFAWSEVARVMLYELQIETSDGQVVLNALFPRGALRYSAPPWLAEKAGGRALRWRVVALDASGGTIVRSAWRLLGTGLRH